MPGIATVTDPNLINPWGMAFRGTSPFWIANNGTNKATVYNQVSNGPVTINPLLVTIPGTQLSSVVANSTTDWDLDPGVPNAPSAFIFASLTGNISGWNPSAPGGATTSIVMSGLPGHVYTGLAVGSNSGGNRLYAADFANGNIDVFTGAFVLTTTTGSFADPTIPTTVGNTFHPYNIQNIGGSLYVMYAKVGTGSAPVDGVGNGFVRRFNTDGVRDLTFGINNGPLNSPWGVGIAPSTFGIFGSALIIGNFGAGNPVLHAFNPTTGAFLGTIQDENGDGIVIEKLHALIFGNGVNGGDPGTLYFTSGIGNENHGLFGSLRPTTATAKTLYRFSDSDFLVNETDGTINVTVNRIGDTTGAGSINYAPLPELEPLSAQPGSDFTLAPGTLSFAAGETSKTFPVTILTDANIEGDETIRLVLSNPTGGGLAEAKIAALLIIDHGTKETKGDLQGDGKADLVWHHDTSGANAAWLMNGGTVAATGSLPTVADSNFTIVGLGDFQGDGRTDVLWRNGTTGANVIWLMNGLSVAVTGVLPMVPAPWTVAGVGDFQGDKKADIIWRNPSTGDNSVWFMNGTALAVSAALPTVDPNFSVVAVGDFQADGKADLFWRNSSTGANVVWLMNGSSVAATAVLMSVPDTNQKIVGCGDFQADGKDDVLWRNSSTGGNSIWFMNGTAPPVTVSIPPVADTTWKVARVADLSADRKVDIVWRNTVSGANALWIMDGPSILNSPSLPAVADTGFQIATTR